MSEKKSGNPDPHSQAITQSAGSAPAKTDDQSTSSDKPAVKRAQFAAAKEAGGSGNTDPHSQP